MQSPEEFCRQIDIKLRKKIIASLTAVSAAVIATGVLIYIFAPKDDFLISKFSGHSCKTGLSSDFLLTSLQSHDNVSLEAIGCDCSDSGFTVTVHAVNTGRNEICFSPADLRVYVTDTARGSKPSICRTDMTESIVIPSGLSADFTVSGTFSNVSSSESVRITLVFTDAKSGNIYSIMPD